MIFSDLRDYLAERQRASMADMVNRFDIDPEALLGMLEQWEAKGRVRRIDASGVRRIDAAGSDPRACGSCCACAESDSRIYEWVGRTPRH